MIDPLLWKEAAAFAARAHRHQCRKDACTPYIAHPARVALTCAAVFGCTDEAVLAAAFLHDTIEDSGTDYDELLETFGREVAGIVALLTKDMRLVEPEREAAYDRQLAQATGEAGWKARLIKLADVYDNVRDTFSEDAKRKMLEKGQRALELAGADVRCREAHAIVQRLMRSLEADLEARTEEPGR